MPRLIDAHTHVQFAAYEADAEAVIARALQKDIWLTTVGSQWGTSQAGVTLAEKYAEGVYATVGLHPVHVESSFHDAKELGDGPAAKAFTSRGEVFDFDAYRTLALREKVVAIGECGLDYYRLGSETKEKQKEAFMAQIVLSGEVRKPLMIHCRDASSASSGQAASASSGQAYDDLIDILRSQKGKMNTVPGIAHFFAGSVQHARELLELGFSFSFGGVVSFARDYDEVVRYIGLPHIVLETDAPYVTPVPHRGKRNEPSYVAHVCEALSKVLDVDMGVVAVETTKNARKIFGI